MDLYQIVDASISPFLLALFLSLLVIHLFFLLLVLTTFSSSLNVLLLVPHSSSPPPLFLSLAISLSTLFQLCSFASLVSHLHLRTLREQ
eukprot:m.260807 g.260807  ORF g.260807 m.260807 type:complete len:89 (-) comp41990_c0_seq1:9-275(-)